ncbi:hypothetical protein C1H46_019912 [Malus baccata]|uniref:Uncharacterized protein n=2 Tax=Maleae TaxID=721813 RepID=A0A5N5HFY0_9ROSA|nr:hypothetical protein D8674_024256 [Pyrus ussuriensis x Pyrus communis]TQD94491.1 hypothetical protein C1H46_019912 [Malus baccata]
MPFGRVKIMKHYLYWAEALATVWGFILLVGLICCCLGSNPRQNANGSTGNASFSCDAGYAGC